MIGYIGLAIVEQWRWERTRDAQARQLEAQFWLNLERERRAQAIAGRRWKCGPWRWNT